MLQNWRLAKSKVNTVSRIAGENSQTALKYKQKLQIQKIIDSKTNPKRHRKKNIYSKYHLFSEDKVKT